MKKIIFFLLILSLNFAFAKKPNVVFFMADDLGWMDLSCQGSTFYKTPNIDNLAKNGMRFTSAYSASPLCSPTRASIITGQYPARIRLTTPVGHLPDQNPNPKVSKSGAIDRKSTEPDTKHWLDLDYTSVAQIFKKNGYKTFFAGKWHLGPVPHTPESFGFDKVVGGREFPGPPLSSIPGRGCSFFSPWAKRANMPDVPDGTHCDDVIAQEALKFIEENKDSPLFMFIWIFDVHAPFQAKADLIEKYKKTADKSNPQHSPTMAAMVETMDNVVGTVMSALDKYNLTQDTIVMFSSDNGGNMYDIVDGTTPTSNFPLKGQKGNNHEGGARVPLIVQYPALVKKGQKSTALVSSVDYFPTFLELCGLDLMPEAHKDGVSFKKALEQKHYKRPALFCHFAHNVFATDNIANSSVIDGEWKLYRFWYDNPDQTHRYELYNLKYDISETKNLAKKYPYLVKQLDIKIQEYLDDTKALVPLKNPKYNASTVGTWSSTTGAKLTGLGNDQLEVEFTKNSIIYSRFIPTIMKKSFIVLEVKANKDVDINVKMLPRGGKNLKPIENTYSVNSSWKKIVMECNHPIAGPVHISCDENAKLVFKDMQLLTPDGSVIRHWNF